MIKANLKALIAKNKIEETINELLSYHQLLNGHPLYNQIIMLSAQYHALQQDKAILSTNDIKINQVKINRGVLKVIDKLPALNDTERGIKNKLMPVSKIVELTLDDSLENFNSRRKEDLIRVIAALLEIAPETVIIRQLKKGSLLLYIEVDLSLNFTTEILGALPVIHLTPWIYFIPFRSLFLPPLIPSSSFKPLEIGFLILKYFEQLLNLDKVLKVIVLD